jgi:hypothetical protein
MLWALGLGAAVVGRLGYTPAVLAQIAVSANDTKLMLVNGAATVVPNPAPDTVAIIDLKQFPPKILAELEAPASVVGPPLSVAITPDELLALVTAVIATIKTGRGPAGLSINRQDTYTGKCYRRGHAQGLGGV